jgi:hypothetical protein
MQTPLPTLAPLHLVVDEAVRVDTYSEKPANRWPQGTRYQRVHVIHDGGEIRGYVLRGSKLYLRSPCYSGDWPVLDEAVAAATGAKIAPCVVDPGSGSVLFLDDYFYLVRDDPEQGRVYASGLGVRATVHPGASSASGSGWTDLRSLANAYDTAGLVEGQRRFPEGRSMSVRDAIADERARGPVVEAAEGA